MIILVPMGGKGTRFSNAGYTTNKACIPTTDRHSGQKLPMIVCALKDMPGINDPENKIICVDRDLHENNGTERIILEHFPNVVFIHDHVMLDQAFGCFLAREFLMTNEELFIGSCDNGFDYDNDAFDRAREHYDVLMISHTADVNIAQNPKAHSWAALDAEGKYLTAISLKEPISEDPMQDHATTGMFWFKRANDFLKNLEKMIWQKDMLDGKYYVDKVLQYCIDAGLRVGYFDVRFICWGTPKDFNEYEKSLEYWLEFKNKEDSM